MNAKRVLAPVLMIAVCLVILASFKLAAVSEPTPSPTSAPLEQSSPSPTPLLATTAAPTPRQESPSSIPAVGETAPDFSLPSVSGEPVVLSSYRGERNVVVLFYRTGS
jgi:cytochrome oxidase Cu insertion factor (SCO1/SenC/PrrC family)